METMFVWVKHDKFQSDLPHLLELLWTWMCRLGAMVDDLDEIVVLMLKFQSGYVGLKPKLFFKLCFIKYSLKPRYLSDSSHSICIKLHCDSYSPVYELNINTFNLNFWF